MIELRGMEAADGAAGRGEVGGGEGRRGRKRLARVAGTCQALKGVGERFLGEAATALTNHTEEDGA